MGSSSRRARSGSAFGDECNKHSREPHPTIEASHPSLCFCPSPKLGERPLGPFQSATHGPPPLKRRTGDSLSRIKDIRRPPLGGARPVRVYLPKDAEAHPSIHRSLGNPIDRDTLRSRTLLPSSYSVTSSIPLDTAPTRGPRAFSAAKMHNGVKIDAGDVYARLGTGCDFHRTPFFDCAGYKEIRHVAGRMSDVSAAPL